MEGFILLLIFKYIWEREKILYGRIVINVDPATAAKWRTASFKLKKEIGSLMNDQIATIIDQKEETDILQFLSELRAEMKAKGLTQQILDDILNNE